MTRVTVSNASVDADESDGESIIARFTSVDFSGVDFTGNTNIAVSDDNGNADDWTSTWDSWEQTTPFVGFSNCPEIENGNDEDFNVYALVRDLVDMLLQGQYAQVLRSPIATELFKPTLDSSIPASTSTNLSLRRFLNQRVIEMGSQSTVTCMALELIGIASFNLYLQNNYTGPTLQPDDLDGIHPHSCMLDMLQLSQETENDIHAATNGADSMVPDPTLPHNSNGFKTAILAELVVDGEWPCPVCYTPYFLLVARAILSTLANTVWVPPFCDKELSGKRLRRWLDDDGEAHGGATANDMSNTSTTPEHSFQKNTSRLTGVRLWSARACVAHERLLQARQPTETLWMEAKLLYQACCDSVAGSTAGEANLNGVTLNHPAAVVWLEWGLAQHFFDQPGKGKNAFREAVRSTGLRVEVTGAVGKRTKFQQQATAQMLVRAQSAASPPSFPAATDTATEKNRVKEQMIEHSEDGILLERVKFDIDAENELLDLTILDQSILLALCLDVKNSNPADCLTGEEMAAFLSRVLDHHDDWMVYSTALLERAWLEFERSHARERAILQMQALADQHTNRLTITQSTRESIENSAPVQERLCHLHSIVYPPRWSMIEDLADRYASLGIVSSAADLFAEIELWDSVVDCYRRAGRISQAETIVREQISLKETPRMWAALGDLTKDPECYQKAIVLSKGRYFDAYLALGEYYFGKGEMETAADNYAKALKVRPIIPSAWFRLGTINMKLCRWQSALRAFSEVVLQKPEEAEAWANIAAVHMRNKQPAEAYPALNESLKYMRSNWRVWTSKLYTCLDLEKYDEAIQACNTLLDLRTQKQAADGIPALEEKCVRAIVGGALKKFHESQGDTVALDSSRRTLSRVHTLLDRVSSQSDAAPWIFETMAVFHEQAGHDADKVLELLSKEYRALQSSTGWERDNTLIIKMCQVVSSMVQIYKSGGREEFTQARFALRGVIRKVHTCRPDDITIPLEVQRLEVLLQEIDEKLHLPTPS